MKSSTLLSALQQKVLMALSSKKKLQLSDVAPDLARMILKSISEESLSQLQDWGVNPDSGEHKLEILILGLYALRVSAQEGLRHIQKNYVALLYYTEQDIKTIYVEVLKYGTSHQFETTLQDRYREYDSIMESSVSEDRKLQRIGLSFAKHIGTADAALIYWSSKTFVRVAQGFTKFLSNLDSQFELVSTAQEASSSGENKAEEFNGAKRGAGCLGTLLIIIGVAILITTGDAGTTLGAIIAFAGGLCWIVAIIFSAAAQKAV